MKQSICQFITRRSASNLAGTLFLLPREKRAAMASLYAFCRQVDDVADDSAAPLEERRALLAEWRADVRTACEQGRPRFAVNRELQPVIARHRLPFDYFDELLRGVEMDLDHSRYETRDDLEQYCYRVAAVVGLLSIEVFGYRNPRCRDYAVCLGKALQLTNILRDVRTDAQRGRIYLPLSELRRFRVTPQEILRGERSERFCALAASVADRAREFYGLARAALPAEDRQSMIAAELMGAIYWRLLETIQRSDFDVFRPSAMRLSKPLKLFLAARTWWRVKVGPYGPGYGIG